MKVSATWEWETARLAGRALQKQESPRPTHSLQETMAFPHLHTESGGAFAA
jgi:hypothetical protein